MRRVNHSLQGFCYFLATPFCYHPQTNHNIGPYK